MDTETKLPKTFSGSSYKPVDVETGRIEIDISKHERNIVDAKPFRLKERSPKQRCQFFRWRFKGWLMGTRSIINGFKFSEDMSWLSVSERARIQAIQTNLDVMITQVDERTKKIIKETK